MDEETWFDQEEDKGKDKDKDIGANLVTQLTIPDKLRNSNDIEG